jgi:ATP adenylyltransferase
MTSSPGSRPKSSRAFKATAVDRPPIGRLDAHWRGEYIESATGTERAQVEVGVDPDSEERCVFCAILAGQSPHADDHVVHRDNLAVCILNAYPYTSGHVLVMPTRHAGEIDALTDDEYGSLFALVRRATSAITRAYHPDGLNVGMNLGRAAGAGIPGHLHAHVLPRWHGDTNFMTSVAEVRVVPESLDQTWSKLRAAW